MRLITRAAAAASFVCGAALPSQAQSSLKERAAKVELHPYPSRTLSDQQFLSGATDGKPVTMTGELRIAQGSGRLPLVILMHGSGGIGANIESWAKLFNAMGVSTFAIDGFTGRGLTSVNTDQAALGRLNFIIDIYQALGMLAKHPRVDPDRIVLMGFSRSGQAALYASLTRFHKMWNKSGAQFAAYIPFYPDCITTFVADTEVAARPIRIFHGTPDDYNPVGACKGFVERLRAAGRDVALTEYPNAAHAFDNPLAAVPPAVAKNSMTVRHCTIREEPVGLLINASTKEPFTYQDPCVERDPHVGHDAAATEAAKTAVKELLRTIFRLE